jgi:ribosome biogenesis GTPase
MPKRRPREKDFTRQFLEGGFDTEKVERLDGRQKSLRDRKIADTAELRSVGETADINLLPVGRVMQVFSLYIEVLLETRTILCTIRKTLNARRDTSAVVGDLVRIRLQVKRDESGPEEGVIERIEPRTSILTRSDSFKALTQHPIVANATRMMIVVAVTLPRPKWGLVDRMLLAARSGSLEPVICLNKIDLGEQDPPALAEARQVLAHYRSLGYRAEETCATQKGSEPLLQDILRGHKTVLAGHSGVGKSSLVRLIAPNLDIRIGDISTVHHKGKHTTTSARIYALPDLNAEVIDTPGVKLFGLWNLTPDHLDDFYPDIANGTAPDWRIDSHTRILESLTQSPN